MSHTSDDEVRVLLAVLEGIDEKIEASKPLYAERDTVTLRLRALGFSELTMNGKEYRMKHNFEKGNTAYRVAFVREYEVVIKELKEKK